MAPLSAAPLFGKPHLFNFSDGSCSLQVTARPQVRGPVRCTPCPCLLSPRIQRKLAWGHLLPYTPLEKRRNTAGLAVGKESGYAASSLVWATEQWTWCTCAHRPCSVQNRAACFASLPHSRQRHPLSVKPGRCSCKPFSENSCLQPGHCLGPHQNCHLQPLSQHQTACSALRARLLRAQTTTKGTWLGYSLSVPDLPAGERQAGEHHSTRQSQHGQARFDPRAVQVQTRCVLGP